MSGMERAYEGLFKICEKGNDTDGGSRFCGQSNRRPNLAKSSFLYRREIPFQFDILILFIIKGAADFVLSEAEWKGGSDISPRLHILGHHAQRP